MDLSIEYQKTNNATEAKNKVLQSLTPDTFKKFGVKAKVEEISEHEIKVSGKGFDVIAEFNDSKADISVKLSFLLKPLKNKILSSIEREFAKII